MAANTQGATTGQASTLAAGPAVTGVNPAAGPASGGTAVTITGSGFTGASSVTFGGTPAAYTTFSDTQIIAFAPAHAPGQTLVKVAGPAGASSQNVFYTYLATPTVTGISPTTGPTAGGTTVTITGTGLTGTTTVTIGGTPATFTVNSDTQITATTPAHAPGQAQVTITTPAGTSTQNVFYTYLATPTITSLTPTAGPAAGGNGVTITGTDLGFTGAVTFGGTRAAFTVLSNTQIVAVAPAGTGTVVVAVTTPGGTSVGSAYTYVPAPMI
ncbi:MAG TPA: IPT/TIG domain-containing protein [Amycolatopsis sp.]|uniref:IPT/TIG domain-containing protein n=1 Tax=Amycolatopsis sp. TaxID=37632 RepID=UPI002B49DC05|nr:IPT/TIG domain-containing protein [Amycolatopsis sp.]HKS45044.1 IPT/TIG domain-containing protein [Amycolatopsis sp.]